MIKLVTNPLLVFAYCQKYLINSERIHEANLAVSRDVLGYPLKIELCIVHCENQYFPAIEKRKIYLKPMSEPAKARIATVE